MPEIKLIVGLGNPGNKYVKTRHNAGFNVLDILAGDNGWKNWRDTSHISVRTSVGKIILAKPALFMNNSGDAVRALLDYHGISPDEMIVISDDFSLELGLLRFRLKGSSGGHNGLESIINHTGTSSFPRLRIGIGQVPPFIDPADFVLSQFMPEENAVMKETYIKAAAVIEDALSNGMETAVSKVPGLKKELKK